MEIKTKALSLVYLDPDHQNLIDRILKLNQDGLNCRKIADHLNGLGVTSWTGKRFYPELIFGVIRKSKLKVNRNAAGIASISCRLGGVGLLLVVAVLAAQSGLS